MVKLVPNFVREIWDIWNIRGLVLTSFTLQVCLLLFVPLRKCTNKSIVTWFLWLAYLFADYVATFCVGLIFDKRNNFSDNSANSYIVVFWAPFLLLHLGGPDTITAFALEDNELWLRHLLGLVFQVAVTVYLFLLPIPGNTLWIPTTLMFVAGMIKYIERTRSLFLASKNTIQKSMKYFDTRGTNLLISYATCMKEYFQGRLKSDSLTLISPVRISDVDFFGFSSSGLFQSIPFRSCQNATHVELLEHGFSNFNDFKRLIVDNDITLDFEVDSHPLFQCFLDITPENAFIVIEAELSFMYEFFFTKASVLWNKVGCLVRLASFITTVAALSVFIIDKKHGFNQLEVKITYILLLGALALDSMANLRLIFSDWSIITCSPRQSSAVPGKIIPKLAYNLKAKFSKVVLIPFLKFRKPRWSNCKKEPYKKFQSLSTSVLFRKWSGTISGYDFIKYCLHKTEEGKQSTGKRSRVVVKFLKQIVYQVIYYFGAVELVESWMYKANNPFLKELWEFIFKEQKNKSEDASQNKEIIDRICEATGEWVLQEQRGELDQQMIHGLIWHIATGLCYYVYFEADQNYVDHRCFSKLLSDYMMYLLAMEPSVISAATSGIDRSTMYR